MVMDHKHKHAKMRYEIGQSTLKNGCLEIDEIKLYKIINDAISRVGSINSNVTPLQGNTENLIDPFAACLEIATFFNNDKELWATAEEARSRQKTLMNIVGDVQQSIIGCIPNWESHSTGTNRPDIEGRIEINGKEIYIIGEVKNKHNTLNGGSLAEVVRLMNNFSSSTRFLDSIPILVQVVKQSFSANGGLNNVWSDNNGVRIMSGRIFYSLAANPKANVDLLNLNPNAASTKEAFLKLSTFNSFDCINEYIFYCLEDLLNLKFDFKTADYIKFQRM